MRSWVVAAVACALFVPVAAVAQSAFDVASVKRNDRRVRVVDLVHRSGQATLPTVFAAVEEQLGLKLQRETRGTVAYVIVAAARTPTEN